MSLMSLEAFPPPATRRKVGKGLPNSHNFSFLPNFTRFSATSRLKPVGLTLVLLKNLEPVAIDIMLRDIVDMTKKSDHFRFCREFLDLYKILKKK